MSAALLIATSASAQHEIGGIVGGLNGASYKYWFNDAMAIQADLAVGLTAAYGGVYYQGTNLGEGQMDLYDFTLNPNFLYHFDLPQNFKIYTGGGVNLGMYSGLNGGGNVAGKFGVNAVAGFSYDIQSAPVVLACDFRPGYGLGFTTADDAHISFFDWKVAFAVRYRF